MLGELWANEIKTPKALSELTQKYRHAVLAEEAKRVESTRQQLQEVGGNDEEIERAKAGVFFTHAGLTRTLLDHALGPTWRAKRVAHVPKKRMKRTSTANKRQ